MLITIMSSGVIEQTVYQNIAEKFEVDSRIVLTFLLHDLISKVMINNKSMRKNHTIRE